MLQVHTLRARPIICVRLVGVQCAAEFGALSGSIVECHLDARPLRILFDWIALEGWGDGKADVPASCKRWMSAAHQIERASIVHERRWDRQAAVLAAALRTQMVEVRSWPPSHLARALDWLARYTDDS